MISDSIKSYFIFSLVVTHYPQLNQPIPDQLFALNQLFELRVPEDTFIDLDNERLTYTVNDLPNTYQFDTNTLILSGTPTQDAPRHLNLELIASDPHGASSNTYFNITFAPAPEFTHPICPQLAGVNTAYRFALPEDLLIFDAEQTTTLSAQPLPNWLGFNPQP